MRDISKKVQTLRTAVAESVVHLSPSTIAALNEGRMPKGDPFPVAKVAAIQAAKNTSQLIPYCHPLPIDSVECRFEIKPDRVIITAEVKAIHKTGVEMEALTAASIAALTLYDMAKPIDDAITIDGIRLVLKKGGKSDFRDTFARPLRAAVLVMSDSVASGKKSDASGRMIRDRLKDLGVQVEDYRIVPDDLDTIVKTLTHFADTMHVDLVLTTGGTGLGPRDTTPEAMAKVIEKEVPGVAEAARGYGQQRTPYAMLSRSRAGLRGKTVIVNLPGSSRGAEESLDALLPSLLHIFSMMEGRGH